MLFSIVLRNNIYLPKCCSSTEWRLEFKAVEISGFLLYFLFVDYQVTINILIDGKAHRYG